MPEFCHLHCHTQFSLLDGASAIPAMMAKAKANQMKAVAITDHGNMFGAFQFVNEAEKQGIKPIIGCEFYVVEDRFKRSFVGGEKDKRYHQLLLAKNQKGYENISKLCSLGFMEGLYGKYPRVDRDLIKQYSEGLIATTCCIGAEVPQAIIHKGEEEAEKIFKSWLDIFGDDYFIELQRHHLTNIDKTGVSQEDVNQVLIKWSKKYNVPVIATNDAHYVNEEDHNAHDILLCVNTGEFQKTPIGDGKGHRFGFPNNEFYFKTPAEMLHLFSDIPEAIDNTMLIADRVVPPKLKRDVLLPNFILPESFRDQDEYLLHLTYQGALKRYGEISESICERIDFELATIKKAGYPGYFLIVQDFTTAARSMGVGVGPGRGSAAGSVVAYCLGITNVDPIKYDLLFERFLNPDRVSMPDIDIDFDDVGRSKVIDYVIEKYGKRQVAQIITYGSMAAKTSVRDAGRVMGYSISEVENVTKLIPDMSLNDVLDKPVNELKQSLRSDQFEGAMAIRKISEEGSGMSEVLKQAKKLEGSVRNTGVHACGVIITPTDITDLIPVSVAKDSDLLVTQYDNDVVEKAGLLKMDFLGLRTLSIIQDSVIMIKENHGIDINLDEIDLTDDKTFKLFQAGKTIGIFQFESDGMQKYLKDLKPNRFEDLIAMNALYRPGPLAYIPKFVNRKHGREAITYDDPAMEEILKETYGITVYQEQVMRLSQILGGFSKGQADMLRKAMGKKDRAMLDSLKEGFMKNSEESGHDPKIMAKVWSDWEAFAQYAFNKSHSTCYSVLAYQTGYLKANYPAEFMAAQLTHNMADIKKVGFYIEECKSLGIKVLGPSLNESKLEFIVNKEGAIRFGLAAIKGVGEQAAIEIIRERQARGSFSSIFDFTCRVNLKTVNKKTFESLALSGGFDEFTNAHRAQYVEKVNEDSFNGIELAIKFGIQNPSGDQMQGSLFGGGNKAKLQDPELPKILPWTKFEMLNREREVLGIFLSGHPLDDYKIHIDRFCSHSLSGLQEKKRELIGRDVKFAGLLTKAQVRKTKDDTPFGIYTIEDYDSSLEIALFKDDFAKFNGYFVQGNMLYIQGKFEQDYRNPDDGKLRIQSVSFLQDIQEKLVKSVTISLSVDEITHQFMKDLEDKFLIGNEGVPINFEFIDQHEKLAVRCRSKSLKTDLDAKFLKTIGELALKFSIN